MNVIEWGSIALDALAKITNQIIDFLYTGIDLSFIGLGQINTLTLVTISLVALLLFKIFKWLLF